MLRGAGEEHWIWFYYFLCRFIQSPSVKRWRLFDLGDIAEGSMALITFITQY
jgi:hypothetical protein